MIKKVQSKKMRIGGTMADVRESRYHPGAHVLVHDGKQIIACHGPEVHTGTGNPAHTMVVGTADEITEEIRRLGLVDPTITAQGERVDVG